MLSHTHKVISQRIYIRKSIEYGLPLECDIEKSHITRARNFIDDDDIRRPLFSGY